MQKREFEELNEMEQIDVLFDGVTACIKAIKSIKTDITELKEALLGTSPATGAGAKQGASLAEIEAIQAKFPKFSSKSKVSTFEKHCATLGAIPTDAQMLKVFEALPNNAHWERIEHDLKISHATSLAWTYLLEKRGWLKYCKVTRNYEKQTLDIPGPVVS